MSYALVGTGAATTGFNATLAPAIPSAAGAGNLLLLFTGSYQGSLSTPTVAGWTKLSPGVNANQVAIFGKIAVGGDATPSISWGNQFAFAFVVAYSGNPASVSGIVHASSDRANDTTNSIGYAALTITQPGCLVLAAGSRDKTSASNGGSFLTYGSFAIRQSSISTNTSNAAVLNDLIQTTAANVAAGFQTFSIADGSAQQYESITLALLPASAFGVTLTAGSGTYSTTGSAAIFTPGFASNTLLAATGAFDLVGAPSSSDMQITADPGMLSLAGSGAQLAVGGMPPTPTDPNQFSGHWHHLRKKELAKLKRIELALRKARGEIKDEPLHVEPVAALAHVPEGPKNAKGLDERGVDISQLLAAAMSANPPVDRIKETPGQKALREYEEMISKLTRMVPAARDKVH